MKPSMAMRPFQFSALTGRQGTERQHNTPSCQHLSHHITNRSNGMACGFDSTQLVTSFTSSNLPVLQTYHHNKDYTIVRAAPILCCCVN